MDRTKWFVDANAVLVSAVVHLTGLIALGLLTLGAQHGPERLLLATAGEEPIRPAQDDHWLHETIELQADADSAALAMGPVRLFDSSTMATADFAEFDASLEVAAETTGFEGAGFADFGEEQARLVGNSEFFGASGYGQSFVYVVDCSGSMNLDGRFWRAREELIRSIESLESDQTYFVIFFNHQAHPMDAEGPIAATEENLQATRRWVSHFEAGGGTRPLQSLLIALSLEPDAIYFLSDGKFHGNVLSMLRAKNRPRNGKRIPIHAIAFVNRETQGLMRAIARGSGGEYRFVR